MRGMPAGQFITSIGGFNPVQFAEKRLPNLAELDAIAPIAPGVPAGELHRPGDDELAPAASSS